MHKTLSAFTLLTALSAPALQAGGRPNNFPLPNVPITSGLPRDLEQCVWKEFKIAHEMDVAGIDHEWCLGVGECPCMQRLDKEYPNAPLNDYFCDGQGHDWAKMYARLTLFDLRNRGIDFTIKPLQLKEIYNKAQWQRGNTSGFK